ncbi:MAG TPA: PAS domain S-box protein, partial [Puia sp.]
MFKEKSHHILLFCSIVTIASAVLQYINPSLTFFDGGLITAILLTVFLQKDFYTHLFGGIGIALVIIASFYGAEDLDRKQMIFQHLFSLIIIVLSILFVLYVKRLYRSIDSEQHQFRALFEHATEGIILTDKQGNIVLLNPSCASMFGYSAEELPGKSIDLLIPQRFHHRHAADRSAFYQHPGNRAMGHGRDLFARKKNGSEFPVEVSLSYYKQRGDIFVIAFIVDITQRKQSEKELLLRQQQLEQITGDVRKLNSELEAKVEQRTAILREALQELEKSQDELHIALNKEKELNEIKSRFVSMASHEFRTPLSTILSSANLLSKYTQTEDQERRDKHIKRTTDAVKHLNNLLDDFLSLGRLEEGKVKAEPSSVTLCALLEEVAEEMQALAKPGQSILCSCPSDYTLDTDRRLLKNILINLLSNAVKFSP